MKQYIILPIAIITMIAMILFTSCTISVKDSKEIKEAGEIKTETRSLEAFNELSIEGLVEVEYIISDSTRMELEGGENILPTIKTDLRGTRLWIKDERNSSSPQVSSDGRTIHYRGASDSWDSKTSNVKIRIYAPCFNEVQMAGASTFNADSLSTSSFIGKLAGACNLNIKNLSCDNTTISTAGASELNLGLTKTKSTQIETAGSSEGNIHFNDCEYALIKVAGACTMKLSGTLNSLDKNIAGAADINTDNLTLKNNN